MLIAWALDLVLLIGWRLAFLRRGRIKWPEQRVLVVGTDRASVELAQKVAERERWGWKVSGLIDECIDQARRTGYAETILGRRRPVPELRSRNRQQVSLGERIAVNTVVQGSAADLIKRAMIDIHRELKTGDHTARMLIQVHDELVFEVPHTDVEREAEMIRDRMENAMTLHVPLVADVAWGRTWAEGK